MGVVGMELDGMPAACHRRERGQGWHEQPTGEGVVDCADQILVDARFQHVAVGAVVDCRDDEFVIPVHRQENNLAGRAILPELLERLKTVETGHGDVEHDHVGPKAPGQVKRLMAVARNGHDVKIGKKPVDRFEKRPVIVGQQDTRSDRRCDVQWAPQIRMIRIADSARS